MTIVDNSKSTYLFDFKRQYEIMKTVNLLFPKPAIQVQFLVGTPASPLILFELALSSCLCLISRHFPQYPAVSGEKLGKALISSWAVQISALTSILSSFSSKIITEKHIGGLGYGKALY